MGGPREAGRKEGRGQAPWRRVAMAAGRGGGRKRAGGRGMWCCGGRHRSCHCLLSAGCPGGGCWEPREQLRCSAILCLARPGPRLPFAAAELTVSPRGREARRQRVRPALGVGRGGGCPVARAGTFLSREELAPGAGVFPARGSGEAWAPGGVEPRRARPREELGVCPKVMTVRRGRRAVGATVGGGQPGELGGNLRPGSYSKSPESPRHVAARALIGAGRALRGVPVRPGRVGWAPRSSAQEAPRETRVNFGHGARMWGGDPGPLSRLLGPAPPSVAGRGVGTWTVAIWALPVRYLLRGCSYFCPPACARAEKGARWSAALSLGADRRAVAGGPKPGPAW